MARYYGKGFRLTMTGDEAVRMNLARLAITQPEAFKKAIYAEGEEIFQESHKLAPEDTGALKESGKVRDGYEKKNYVVAVGYGGKNKNPKNKTETRKYTRFQHETNPQHYKFLERPFMKAMAGMLGRITTRMKGVK